MIGPGIGPGIDGGHVTDLRCQFVAHVGRAGNEGEDVSDQAPGPGWWIAADGQWYPPELHPSALPPPPPRPRDPRLPPAGTLIRKRFHETDYEVRIHDDDFELAGKRYRSLSGVARAITGTGWNGFLFFERELALPKGGEP